MERPRAESIAKVSQRSLNQMSVWGKQVTGLSKRGLSAAVTQTEPLLQQKNVRPLSVTKQNKNQ